MGLIAANPLSISPLRLPSVFGHGLPSEPHPYLVFLSNPPGSIIYPVYHFYLHLVYVGLTTSALANRLRKHHSDPTSHHNCPSPTG